LTGSGVRFNTAPVKTGKKKRYWGGKKEREKITWVCPNANPRLPTKTPPTKQKKFDYSEMAVQESKTGGDRPWVQGEKKKTHCTSRKDPTSRIPKSVAEQGTHALETKKKGERRSRGGRRKKKANLNPKAVRVSKYQSPSPRKKEPTPTPDALERLGGVKREIGTTKRGKKENKDLHRVLGTEKKRSSRKKKNGTGGKAWRC